MRAAKVVDRFMDRVLLVRGRRVLLLPEVAELYQVPQAEVLKAMKRHAERFPRDFVFPLNKAELAQLTRPVRRALGRQKLPPLYAFTEEGVVMLSAVLANRRAAEVSVDLVRGFVRLREVVAAGGENAPALAELQARYDKQIRELSRAIRKLLEPAQEAEHPPIGFQPAPQGPQGR